MRVKFFLFLWIALLLAGQATARTGITFGPNKELYEYWTEKGQIIKYAKSPDYGRSFSSPQTLFSLTGEAKLSALKVDHNSNFYFTYLLSGEVFLRSKNSNGKTWDPPLTLGITSDAIHIPEVSLDHQGKIHALFAANEPYLGLNRLYYSSIPSLEPKALFESQDDITEFRLFCLPEVFAAFWKTTYSNRSEYYLSVSINSGESFSSPRRLPFDETPSSFIFEDGKPVFFFFNASTAPGITKKKADFPPLLAPDIISINTQATPEITCRVYTSDPLLYKLEISPAKDFTPEKTMRFEYLIKTSSPEVHFRLPAKLKEDAYFLRAASFDGLSSSPYSKTIPFNVDLTPLTIVLQSPKESDWFRPGSTLLFSGQVYDAQNGLEDETEAKISILGIPLTENDNPLYYADTRKISGFITLPKNLPEGKFPGKILLTDQNGNTGEAVFEIKIDRTPPSLSKSVVFSNPANSFSLPLEDSGAGVNSFESFFKINGIPFEGGASRLFLTDGSYEVEVTPKDLAGNIGKAEKFTLVIDTKFCGLSLLSSGEARVAASGNIISGCGSAPSPFSPSKGEQMSFVYTLPASADLVFYIFDLSGTMVWKKGLANAASGSLAWNGVNHFGVTADRGVYSYLMQASAGGKTESRRGKIIIF